MESDWFCYKQAGMLLEKYENLIELTVKQLIIQSSLTSLIFLGQTLVYGKPNVNVICSKVRYFSYPTRVIHQV